MFVKIIPYYTQIFVSPYPGAILGAIELITSFRTAVYCDVECTVCVLFSASRYNVGLMQRTCTNSKVKLICKTIFQRNKIFVGIQYWQNIIVDVIYIKKLKKKSQFYDFVIFFFISILYEKKKTQSIRCLSVLDREGMAITSPSEFALAMAIKVTDGPKTCLSKLKSVNTSDLIVDVFTGLDITCSRRELKPGTKACPGSRIARWAESKKKKKKKIPTDPPTLWKVISGQSNNLFFWPYVCIKKSLTIPAYLVLINI